MNANKEAEARLAAAVLDAVKELRSAIEMVRPLVGLEDAYPQETYERMLALDRAHGKLDGLRLAHQLVREVNP